MRAPSLPPPAAMLELTDVTVRRGATDVVVGLRLEVWPGAIFWVVGPNGAGKTSLLRVMAGIDRPRTGAVVRRSECGEPFLYFQSETMLPPWSTVGDWERLVLELLPPGSAGVRTPLWPDVGAGRRVGRLSTGERKRLLLDALFRRRGSLLLDEPFEHLSPDAKRHLTRLVAARARTDVVVIATNQATGLAERDGGLLLDGGVAEPLGPGSPGPPDRGLAAPPGQGVAGPLVSPARRTVQ
jgi:ABC-type transport system involved in cytochrome c biogenesis ATPase subunit